MNQAREVGEMIATFGRESMSGMESMFGGKEE